ncbi:MAG: flagellar basal body-associated FliL family protein [Rhizobiaceae bacterium]
MARTTAADQEAPAPKKGPSVVIQALMFLVITAVAAGAGWFAGGMLKSNAPVAAGEAAPPAGHEVADAHGASGGHGGGHGEEAEAAGHGEEAGGSSQTMFNLPPITTNLAAPSDIWARMEVSIKFDTPPADASVVEAVHQDLLGFLRTVKMHQIEGASGIQHLKADLEDRASIRSEGGVKHVYIRTLLFE